MADETGGKRERSPAEATTKLREELDPQHSTERCLHIILHQSKAPKRGYGTPAWRNIKVHKNNADRQGRASLANQQHARQRKCRSDDRISRRETLGWQSREAGNGSGSTEEPVHTSLDGLRHLREKIGGDKGRDEAKIRAYRSQGKPSQTDKDHG